MAADKASTRTDSKQDSASSPTSLSALRSALHAGEQTAAQETEKRLDVVRQSKDLNIFVTKLAESARQRAEESDRRLKEGKPRKLEGIPLAVKDNFCTKGVETTAGSKILQGFVPDYESTVTQKLLDAGAVFIGKTNLDEFAMGSSTENSCFGPTINPVGVEHGYDNLAAGGSSGGSAAAVASSCAVGAIGSDTGGSVRQPASFCGVVGMKPSYGFCSRYGIVAYGSSLDQAGVFAAEVADAALLLDVIVGHDPKDSTAYPGAKANFEAALRQPPAKKRIAIPKEVRAAKSTSEANLVWARAEELAKKIDADLVEVSMPTIKYALPAYYIIAFSEASSNLARYDGVRYGHRAAAFEDLEAMYCKTRAEGFGREAKRRIMMGTFSLSSGYYDQYYDRALRVRRLIAEEFKAAFAVADVMLMPTTPSGAFEIGAHASDPVEMYLEDIYTVPINLAGLPAISIPVATDSRQMPLGLQVIGPQYGDEKVIQAAAALEAAV